MGRVLRISQKGKSTCVGYSARSSPSVIKSYIYTCNILGARILEKSFMSIVDSRCVSGNTYLLSYHDPTLDTKGSGI